MTAVLQVQRTILGKDHLKGHFLKLDKVKYKAYHSKSLCMNLSSFMYCVMMLNCDVNGLGVMYTCGIHSLMWK